MKINKPLSLTIGVPAHNEAKNIRKLLLTLLNQNQSYFNLDKIIVFSDGSTDRTISEAQSINDSRILVLSIKKRKGKSNALNQLMRRTKSDIFVQVDADVLIREKSMIDNLIDPLIKYGADLTSARVKEYYPKNRFERILKISMILKKEMFESINNGDNIYTCHGRARAFSRRLYKNIYFPANIVAEDAYAYLYAESNNYKYKFSTKANVYYLLPKNIKDHEKQSVRFVKSYKQLEEEFGKEFIKKQTSIPLRLSLDVTGKYFLKYPLTIISYFTILFTMKIKSAFQKQQTSTWTIARSSKGGFTN